jgi:hypothetical protein
MLTLHTRQSGDCDRFISDFCNSHSGAVRTSFVHNNLYPILTIFSHSFRLTSRRRSASPTALTAVSLIEHGYAYSADITFNAGDFTVFNNNGDTRAYNVDDCISAQQITNNGCGRHGGIRNGPDGFQYTVDPNAGVC